MINLPKFLQNLKKFQIFLTNLLVGFENHFYISSIMTNWNSKRLQKCICNIKLHTCCIVNSTMERPRDEQDVQQQDSSVSS